MPNYFPEGNTPSPGDNECRSLQKINALAIQWCQLMSVTPTIPYLQNINPNPNDVETISLQKLNACFLALT